MYALNHVTTIAHKQQQQKIMINGKEGYEVGKKIFFIKNIIKEIFLK
jgi:hypothetical protein